MTDDETTLRCDLIATAVAMNASGLNQGTAGNVSARAGEAMLITPSGIPYDRLEPEDLARMPLSRDDGSFEGPHRPSSEWRFHHAILRARPEFGAVVHTHSAYATIVSIQRRAIPAVHYMIAAFGGSTIRCADYATFGTQELSDAALIALDERNGCILASHGAIACAPGLERALWLAHELETLAKQDVYTRLLGGGTILPDAEVARVAERFRTGYGPKQQD